MLKLLAKVETKCEGVRIVEARYLVLNKEVVRKVLTEVELKVLNVFVEKVRKYEGYKSYTVIEVK